MNPMALYSRVVFLVVLFMVSVGIVIPTLISAKSTVAVTLGFILLIGLGPLLYYVAKPLFKFFQPNSKENEGRDA